MKKFNVIFEVSATTWIDVEADTEEEAEEIAIQEIRNPSLCHHCGKNLEISEVGEILETIERR